MLENLIMGFGLMTQWQNILAIIVGSVVGYAIGAFPGLNPSTGVALLVPFTYGMSPLTSLVLLCALYGAAEYGGSITAIAINTPGTVAAAATVIDGYQCTLKGYPGKALGVSIVSSAFGGWFSTIALILISVPLVNFALKFGPPEYFSLGIFGLTIISSLSAGFFIKGFIAALIGLLLKTVGFDPFSGYARFTFGEPKLMEGIPFIPVLMGLFAISEVFNIIEEMGVVQETVRKFSSKLPTLKELKELTKVNFLGSAIGLIVGIIPGAGGAIASFIAYNEAKRISRHPEEFGKGSLEGVAAPEAANNAIVGGALIPLLTLGVPGSATAAILMGALMIHGLQPGPELFVKNASLVYGIFASLFLGNLVMLVMGLIGTKLWVKVIACPRNIVAPMLFCIAALGTYSIDNSLFDVWIMLIFGVIGYILRKLDFPLPPIVLALVLGFMVETSLRRSLVLSNGSMSIFITRPISLILLIMAAISFFAPIVRYFWGSGSHRV